MYDILGPKSLAVHGVHLNDSETEILRETETNLAICPRSNQNNAVGITKWWKYQGVKLGFGTDGIGPDVINDAKAGLYMAHLESGDPSMGFDAASDMLINSNPGIFEKIIGIKCGKLERGYCADMVLWDYDSPTPIASSNIGGHYLYGLCNSRANTVWIDGKLVLNNCEFPELDYPAITAITRELAAKVWKRV
jgi:cytosine/adenosine deaminase-related metal-dependent hydrolase